MRAKQLAVGAIALLVLALAPMAAAGARSTGARAALPRGPSVTAALAALEHGGAIPPALYQQDYSAYVAAKHSLGRLSGTRRTELGAVLANVQAIAAAGQLIPSRLPALFGTLERNRQWWTSEPPLSAGNRVSFPGSRIVWQYYPGQGLEIQWLATFGKANGYFSSHENTNLRQLLSEVIPLASERAGGIAWEYMFRFHGGMPPWTSGLSQGTALQVLARAWSRFREPAYLLAAEQALGIFQTPPPAGVLVKTPAGALYAEYSYAPDDRILNGFIQSLVGLYDYASITHDPLGQSLFEAGDAEGRGEVPHYDTGAWSLYDQFGESNLNYHELLREFLEHLCERTRSIAADGVYCTAAEHFTADLHTPPVIALLTSRLHGGTRAGVQVSLSKISAVSITVRRGGGVVWRNSATVGRGRPKLLWPTPARGGTFSVAVTATDLAGNFTTTSGTIVVQPRRPRRA